MLSLSQSIAYIGPDIGLPFMSAWGAIMAMLLAVLGLILAPFKFFWKGFKRSGIVRAGIAVVVIGALAGGGYFLFKNTSTSPETRIIVLGLDGFDPNLLEKYMAEGLVPNFERLKNEGTYARLGTTNPALSPVAWSSFITGSNPGRHGVFDFLRRNPKTYLPDLTFTDIEEPKPLFQIGDFKFTIAKPRLKPHRKGTAFWDVTTKHRIPTTVIRTPTTFPPDKIHGRMLSGFGVPDIRGGQGTFSFFTTAPIETHEGTTPGGNVVQVQFQSDNIETALTGPRDRSKKPPVDLKAPFTIQVHRSNPHATISLQGQTFDLKVGEWSEWKKVTFKFNPLTKTSGMVRFYLQSVDPEFNLYASPVNFDPRSPAFPISHPNAYAEELAEHIGLFHTLGQAEDTWSLNEGRLSEDTFLQQANQVIQEREAMLLHELNRFEKGLLVAVFDTPDRVQHMFWRFQDPKHPLYDAALAERYADVFPKIYQSMDRILGEVLKFVDEKTVLMVISDHGFSEFNTAIHMNRWLADAGFLKFTNQAKPGETNEFFAHVDWSQTKAYSVGLAGIYLNLEGREGKGIVKREEVPVVTEEIIQALSGLNDPETGQKVVHHIYRKEEIYDGPYVDQAADLVVGLEEGYRFSWQTALGATPPTVFEPNAKRWSGDHCVEPAFVSGVFLSNRKINTNTPRIIDIAATILSLFGIEPPASMDGRPLL